VPEGFPDSLPQPVSADFFVPCSSAVWDLDHRVKTVLQRNV
jgi:hypothetical protein